MDKGQRVQIYEHGFRTPLQGTVMEVVADRPETYWVRLDGVDGEFLLDPPQFRLEPLEQLRH